MNPETHPMNPKNPRKKESAMALDDGEALGLKSESTARLINRALEQTSLIIRQEVALAKAELVQKAKRAVVGVLFSLTAAVIAFVALLCGVTAAIAGLAGVVPTWAAALIIAGVLFLGAGLGALAAVRAFRKATPSTPPDVVASVHADVTEIKEHLRR
jgi:hypothetical protein